MPTGARSDPSAAVPTSSAKERSWPLAREATQEQSYEMDSLDHLVEAGNQNYIKRL